MKTKTKEVTLYIQARKWNSEKTFEIDVDTFESESSTLQTYITLDTVVVNVDVPELNEKVLALAEVEQLQAAIKAEEAKHYLRVTAIEEKIASLMCLENKAGD